MRTDGKTSVWGGGGMDTIEHSASSFIYHRFIAADISFDVFIFIIELVDSKLWLTFQCPITDIIVGALISEPHFWPYLIIHEVPLPVQDTITERGLYSLGLRVMIHIWLTWKLIHDTAWQNHTQALTLALSRSGLNFTVYCESLGRDNCQGEIIKNRKNVCSVFGYYTWKTSTGRISWRKHCVRCKNTQFKRWKSTNIIM